MEKIKSNLIETIKGTYPDAREQDHEGNRLDFYVKKQCVPSILNYIKGEGYIHLSHIAFVDWIEDREFELIYIVWSPKDKIKIFIRARVDRENPLMPNIETIWRQANTYQREAREMYGIQFEGFEAPDEFVLEDWNEMPPMRRDFDTQVYAEETFFHRPGREDAMDVREAIIERSREEIPDFAKKYSR
jgi:NADH-quinone oxidoreductase subunit C